MVVRDPRLDHQAAVVPGVRDGGQTQPVDGHGVGRARGRQADGDGTHAVAAELASDAQVVCVVDVEQAEPVDEPVVGPLAGGFFLLGDLVVVVAVLVPVVTARAGDVVKLFEVETAVYEVVGAGLEGVEGLFEFLLVQPGFFVLARAEVAVQVCEGGDEVVEEAGEFSEFWRGG